MTDARTERLRVACALLAPPVKEGLRVALPAQAGLDAIRAMPAHERDALTGCIDWVLEYEENDMPEGSGRLRGAAA